MKLISTAIDKKPTGKDGSHHVSCCTAIGRKGETTTLWSQSSNQSIMMNPSGTKFSGDKIVPQSDLQVGTMSDRIIKKKVNRMATWNVRSLRVCGKLENIKLEMKVLNTDILGKRGLQWKKKGGWNGNILKDGELQVGGKRNTKWTSPVYALFLSCMWVCGKSS